MKKEDARRAIVTEWMRLPPSERKTGEQAAAFALRAAQRYSFLSISDPYQTIMAWLSHLIGKP